MQNKIFIDGLRLFAHHGVMEQERKLGAYFTIDIEVTTDFSLALDTDDLSKTINYADLFQLIRQEMEKPSLLLEHVAGRIVQATFKKFPSANDVCLKLKKENPPMGADCQGAGVKICMTREEADKPNFI